MITLAAMTALGEIGLIAAGVFVLWLLFAVWVGFYARDCGYPFIPVFLAAMFLSPALVLLVVVVVHGPSGPVVIPRSGRRS